jgi:GT2 family glycosyltransferase
VRYVHNRGITTLSGNYNLGVRHATGDLVLLTQQDCWPANAQTLANLVAEFDAPPVNSRSCPAAPQAGPVVAATALVKLPEEVFATYGFWGKVLMAKWVGTTQQGISGKFDLVRREVFDAIAGYDCEHFRFAGEDVDLCVRLSLRGRVVVTGAEVIHHHHQGNETSAWYVWGKHYMNAEGFGAGLRRHGLRLTGVPYARRWSHHLNKLLYPVLPAVPFFPLTAGVVLWVGSNVAQYHAFRAGTIRLPLLLLFNPLLFLGGLAGTLIGFLRGRQVFKP